MTVMRLAHDHPTGPLRYGDWLCCCEGCHWAAHTQPEIKLVVKRNLGRDTITAGELGELCMDGFAPLLCGEDDYVREVFVKGPNAFALVVSS